MIPPDASPHRLDGITLVWTGSENSGRTIISALEQAGGEVLSHPLIETRSVLDDSELTQVASTMNRFDWVLFASTRAASLVPRPPRPFGGRVGAVGPSTAAVLQKKGWSKVEVPEKHDAASLAELVRKNSRAGTRILFIRGERSLSVLPDRLRQAGVTVESLTVYDTVPVSPHRVATALAAIETSAHGVVMGSPSGVDVLVGAVAPTSLGCLKPGLVWLCLGKTTANRLAAEGVATPVYPNRLSEGAMLHAVASAFN